MNKRRPEYRSHLALRSSGVALLAGALLFVVSATQARAGCNPPGQTRTEIEDFTVTDTATGGGSATATAASSTANPNPGTLAICDDGTGTATIEMSATTSMGDKRYIGWRIEKATGGASDLIADGSTGHADPNEGKVDSTTASDIQSTLTVGSPSVREFYVKAFCDGGAELNSANGKKDADEDYYYDIDGAVIEVKVVVLKVELEELTFSDNTGFTADNGAWISAGNQKWTPTYKTSALFTDKDEKAKINAKLKITPQLSSAISMTIEGTADNGVTFAKTFNYPASTTTYTVNDIEANVAYDANFDYIGEIEWKITFSGCEQDLGETDNNIYYVPEGVESGLHIDTVLYVVCRKMDGKPYGDASARTQVWGEFSDRVVTCADRSTVLVFWKLSTDQDRDTTEELLDDRSGNCVGWSDFLHDCFELAGPSATLEHLDAKDGGWTIVKDVHWQPDPPGTQGAGQTWAGVDADYKHKEYGGANGYFPDVTETIPGQGTSVDPSAPIYQQWDDGHCVVKSGGEFFDPSYGKTSSTQEGLEDLILQGTAIEVGGDYYLKLNTVGVKDLE